MLYLRLNAGNQWGLGHLFRCSLLAETITQSGYQVALIVNDDEYTRHHFRDSSKAVSFLPEDELLPADLNPRPDSVLLVDLPFSLTHEQVTTCALTFSDLILLDQHGQHIEDVSLVVNGIAHPAQASESELPNCYTGPRYIILDPATLTKNRRPRSPVQSVLISMGGSDPFNITSRLLEILPRLHPRMTFFILLGPAFRHADLLRHTCTNIENVRCLAGGSGEAVAKAISQCDIGVLSFGLSCYAAAHAGLPMMMIGHSAEGAAAASVFSGETGTGLPLGFHSRISDREILKNFTRLTTDVELRIVHHEKGRAAVDGRGLQRVSGLITALLSA